MATRNYSLEDAATESKNAFSLIRMMLDARRVEPRVSVMDERDFDNTLWVLHEMMLQLQEFLQVLDFPAPAGPSHAPVAGAFAKCAGEEKVLNGLADSTEPSIFVSELNDLDALACVLRLALEGDGMDETWREEICRVATKISDGLDRVSAFARSPAFLSNAMGVSGVGGHGED